MGLGQGYAHEARLNHTAFQASLLIAAAKGGAFAHAVKVGDLHRLQHFVAVLQEE
jgi:hypothetical protein